MARRAPPASLTPKLFRHFAVVTVALTVCIAVFADGQGDNLLGKTVAAQEAQAQLAVADAARKRVKPVTLLNRRIRDARRSYVPLGAESDDGDSGYGQPMDAGSGLGGGGSSGYARPAPLPAAGMTGQPQSELLPASARNPRGPATPRRPSPEDLAKLEAASLARSGDRRQD